MKKTLALLALTFIVTTAMAQEQVMGIPLKQIIRDLLCSGHRPPIQVDENGKTIPYLRPTAKGIAEGNNISPERMTEILEEMIRENLAIFNEKPEVLPEEFFTERHGAYASAARNVYPLITALQTFHGENTAALLKECAMSKHDLISYNAVEAYVTIAKEEAMSFFQGLIASKQLGSDRRNRLQAHLEKAAAKLKEKNKTPPQTTGVTETVAPPQPPNITPNSVQNITKGIPPIEQPEETSTNKNTVLVIALAAVLALGGGVIAWMKKHGKGNL